MIAMMLISSSNLLSVAAVNSFTILSRGSSEIDSELMIAFNFSSPKNSPVVHLVSGIPSVIRYADSPEFS